MVVRKLKARFKARAMVIKTKAHKKFPKQIRRLKAFDAKYKVIDKVKKYGPDVALGLLGAGGVAASMATGTWAPIVATTLATEGINYYRNRNRNTNSHSVEAIPTGFKHR